MPISVGLRDTPEVLGTLSVGFLLDDRRAEQFKRAPAATSPSRMDGRVRAATLPPEVRGALADHAHADGVSRLRLGGDEYMMTSVPLSLPLGAARQPRRRRAC